MKELCLSNCLPIVQGETSVFIPFPKILALREIQIVQDFNYISNDNNDCIKRLLKEREDVIGKMSPR